MPDEYPTEAYTFSIERCTDPMCGPHVVFYDHHGEAMCQLVVKDAAWWNHFKGKVERALYEAATERDDKL